MKFMRKYILICKNVKPPKLTEEASELISEEYSRLRSQDTTSADVARVNNRPNNSFERMLIGR